MDRYLCSRSVFTEEEKTPMRFLITNDDGIYSPGIRALAEAASRFGDVRIVAPDVEQSSMGHAITHARPLRYRPTDIGPFEAYRVNGTPADCVALGAHHWAEADVVLSGINLGPNLGNSMWHSGTLAGAKQAALLGLRGIALSTPADEGTPDFAFLHDHVVDVLATALEHDDVDLLNINIPPRPQGIRWTSQSVRHYDGLVVEAEDPMERPVYWISVRPLEHVEEGSDHWAVQHQLTSITPLHLDLTAHDVLERRRDEAAAS